MWKDFKEFALRGNMIDLAIGIIIGAAFSGVVGSLVKDVIMPPVGMLLGKVDFTNLFISLDGSSYKSLADAQAAGAATLNYGVFINTLINFFIVALVIFFIVRLVNQARRPVPAPVAAPTTKSCPYCSMTIPLTAKRCPECTTVLEGPAPSIAD